MANPEMSTSAGSAQEHQKEICLTAVKWPKKYQPIDSIQLLIPAPNARPTKYEQELLHP